MGIAVNLDKNLVDIAKSYSIIEHRSIPKQIEYWAKIGRIAVQNRDLTYDAIQGILEGLADVKNRNVEIYKKGML